MKSESKKIGPVRSIYSWSRMLPSNIIEINGFAIPGVWANAGTQILPIK